jgi:hypothetical protein
MNFDCASLVGPFHHCKLLQEKLYFQLHQVYGCQSQTYDWVEEDQLFVCRLEPPQKQFSSVNLLDLNK